ncbi:hypothetical protein [Microbacterium sp. Leaf159]|uniref:hypothetical protein n=1 Tax=Microbacterium sp. Leaf159 TaxID=1736279 RepID=UPI0007017DC8|nr:hypothetical protein [Microbacterium sp. Leaf159]KQR39212.1 hypothetical protein ASF80_07245 [Microbacterium sp. Leaf159]
MDEEDRRALRRWARGALQYFLCLLPLGAAAAAVFFLVAGSVRVATHGELQHAVFGWVTQDLSRYEPVAYPATVEFEYQRAWHDPIETSYDWWLFAANSAILSAILTAVLLLILGVLRVRRALRE